MIYLLLTITDERFLCIDKLVSKELYSKLLLKKKKISSANCVEILLNTNNLELPAILSKYKFLNNTNNLDKKLFTIGLKNYLLCSFCDFFEGTLMHMFCEFNNVISLWKQLKTYFSDATYIANIGCHFRDF